MAISNLCGASHRRCNLVRRDASGEIINLTDGPINLNRLRAKGVDTTLRFQMPKMDIGNLDLMFNAAYLTAFDRYDTLPNGEVRVAKRAGKSDIARESFPRWKANTSLDWSRGVWAANWSMHYIGNTDEGTNGSP